MSIKIRRIDGSPLGALETFDLNGHQATLEADGTLTMLNVLDYTLRDIIVDTPFEEVPPPLDPTTIAGLYAWFDADALTLSNNDPVATWPDLSGNARNLTQGTSAWRPLYKTGIQNGLPGVLFDGTDDALDGGTVITNNDASRTITFVVKPSAAGTGVGRTLWTLYGGDARVTLLDTGWYYSRNEAGAFVTISTDTTSAAVITVRYLSETEAYVYFNGAQVGTAFDPNPAYAYSNFNPMTIGMNPNTNHWAGHIFEALIYDSGISTTDLGALHSHLIEKWGI